MTTAKVKIPYEDLTVNQRRSLAIRLVARSLVVAILLFVAYYTLPMDRPERSGHAVLPDGELSDRQRAPYA